MSRKLVTVRKINDIQAIEGADLIVKATIDGWNVVTKKDEFKVGDYCVYFEIDSFLDYNDDRYDFLRKSSRKKMDGKEGLRLRTIKLRGVVSQGLALPVSMFPEVEKYAKENGGLAVIEDERHDLSEVLNVVKYEPPEVGKGTKPKGGFPWYIPKTDEERIQNIYEKAKKVWYDCEFYPTLKLDGSSVTLAYVYKPELFISDEADEEQGEIVLCSRNLALKYDPEAAFWKGVENDNLAENLKNWSLKNNRQIAVQGELVGPGVQKNREKFNKYKVFAFRVWDIDEQKFVNMEEMKQICSDIGMDTTVIYDPVKPFQKFETLEDMLAYADGDSINHGTREGLVYCAFGLDKQNRTSFKTISNKFLLKGGD